MFSLNLYLCLERFLRHLRYLKKESSNLCMNINYHSCLIFKKYVIQQRNKRILLAGINLLATVCWLKNETRYLTCYELQHCWLTRYSVTANSLFMTFQGRMVGWRTAAAVSYKSTGKSHGIHIYCWLGTGCSTCNQLISWAARELIRGKLFANKLKDLE